MLEYEALKLVKTDGHPNIVELVQAFRYEQDQAQMFNFVFPLALGNLKQLFRGDKTTLEADPIIRTLWSQFEGLASGLACLNVQCHTVHRDIKPSNILVYLHWSGSYLEAKIADFGLAMDLHNATVFTLGTKEAQSAISYDAPEIRGYAKDLDIDPAKIPAPDQLLKGEIWKLGAVFTELLTFLLLGSRGVKQFRNFITSTYKSIDSDTITDIRFDDGVRAKPEVGKWLSRLSTTSQLAAEICPLLVQMLGDAHQRPWIEEIVQKLEQVRNLAF
jgi:serine/threonine protein kinase